MKQYLTKSGDMWDMIAKEQLGGERYTSLLMEANPHCLGTTIFQAGVVLNIPEVATPLPAVQPPWKR